MDWMTACHNARIVSWHIFARALCEHYNISRRSECSTRERKHNLLNHNDYVECVRESLDAIYVVLCAVYICIGILRPVSSSQKAFVDALTTTSALFFLLLFIYTKLNVYTYKRT